MACFKDFQNCEKEWYRNPCSSIGSDETLCKQSNCIWNVATKTCQAMPIGTLPSGNPEWEEKEGKVVTDAYAYCDDKTTKSTCPDECEWKNDSCVPRQFKYDRCSQFGYHDCEQFQCDFDSRDACNKSPDCDWKPLSCAGHHDTASCTTDSNCVWNLVVDPTFCPHYPDPGYGPVDHCRTNYDDRCPVDHCRTVGEPVETYCVPKGVCEFKDSDTDRASYMCSGKTSQDECNEHSICGWDATTNQCLPGECKSRVSCEWINPTSSTIPEKYRGIYNSTQGNVGNSYKRIIDQTYGSCRTKQDKFDIRGVTDENNNNIDIIYYTEQECKSEAYRQHEAYGNSNVRWVTTTPYSYCKLIDDAKECLNKTQEVCVKWYTGGYMGEGKSCSEFKSLRYMFQEEGHKCTKPSEKIEYIGENDFHTKKYTYFVGKNNGWSDWYETEVTFRGKKVKMKNLVRDNDQVESETKTECAGLENTEWISRTGKCEYIDVPCDLRISQFNDGFAQRDCSVVDCHRKCTYDGKCTYSGGRCSPAFRYQRDDILCPNHDKDTCKKDPDCYWDTNTCKVKSMETPSRFLQKCMRDQPNTDLVEINRELKDVKTTYYLPAGKLTDFMHKCDGASPLDSEWNCRERAGQITIPKSSPNLQNPVDNVEAPPGCFKFKDTFYYNHHGACHLYGSEESCERIEHCKWNMALPYKPILRRLQMPHANCAFDDDKSSDACKQKGAYHDINCVYVRKPNDNGECMLEKVVWEYFVDDESMKMLNLDSAKEVPTLVYSDQTGDIEIKNPVCDTHNNQFHCDSDSNCEWKYEECRMKFPNVVVGQNRVFASVPPEFWGAVCVQINDDGSPKLINGNYEYVTNPNDCDQREECSWTGGVCAWTPRLQVKGCANTVPNMAELMRVNVHVGKETGFPKFKDPQSNRNVGTHCYADRESKDDRNSCSRCKYGHHREGLDDFCCTYTNRHKCVVKEELKTNDKSGWDDYTIFNDTTCDPTKMQSHKKSCKRCKYGQQTVGFNYFCCSKDEGCYDQHPPTVGDGKCTLSKAGGQCPPEPCYGDDQYYRIDVNRMKYPSNHETKFYQFEESPTHICDTRGKNGSEDTHAFCMLNCRACKYGHKRYGANDWCCRSDQANCKVCRSDQKC